MRNVSLSAIINEAIQVNFDGQEESRLCFLNVLPANNEKIEIVDHIDPISMIENNLADNSSRSLLQIV